MLIYSYINTRGNWKNSKLCENTPPFGRRVSTEFLVFPISTRVDITVYQHGKCFIFFKCHTTTYQLSYIIRSIKIWNTLPKLITNKSNSLYTFKKYLLDYYFSALECNYNIDDPRSWKTICLKCNQTHDLTKPLTCCF